MPGLSYHCGRAGKRKIGNGERAWNLCAISNIHPDSMLSNYPVTVLVAEGEWGPSCLSGSAFSSADPEHGFGAAEPSGTAACQGLSTAPALILCFCLTVKRHCF